MCVKKIVNNTKYTQDQNTLEHQHQLSNTRAI